MPLRISSRSTGRPNLVAHDPGVNGPQSTTNPCVICGTDASNPAGFGYNNFTGNNPGPYNLWSTNSNAGPGGHGEALANNVFGTAYTVGQIRTALGGANGIDVLIDINTVSGGETLLG